MKLEEYIFYDENPLPYTGKITPYDELDATGYYLDHYGKWMELDFISKFPRSMEEKLQAEKEINIAQRKMAYWEKHPNWDKDEIQTGIAKLKRMWASRRTEARKNEKWIIQNIRKPELFWDRLKAAWVGATYATEFNTDEKDRYKLPLGSKWVKPASRPQIIKTTNLGEPPEEMKESSPMNWNKITQVDKGSDRYRLGNRSRFRSSKISKIPTSTPKILDPTEVTARLKARQPETKEGRINEYIEPSKEKIRTIYNEWLRRLVGDPEREFVARGMTVEKILELWDMNIDQAKLWLDAALSTNEGTKDRSGGNYAKAKSGEFFRKADELTPRENAMNRAKAFLAKGMKPEEVASTTGLALDVVKLLVPPKPTEDKYTAMARKAGVMNREPVDPFIPKPRPFQKKR